MNEQDPFEQKAWQAVCSYVGTPEAYTLTQEIAQLLREAKEEGRKEVLETVKEMREAQRNYFAAIPATSAKRHYLEMSKERERDMDKMVNDALSGQGSLLEEGV